MPAAKDYSVCATHSSHKASRDEIYRKLVEITAPLYRLREKIEKAKRIGVKINMQMRSDDIRRIGDRRQKLVDDDVIWAALRLLRERSDAEIFVFDTSSGSPGERPSDDFNYVLPDLGLIAKPYLNIIDGLTGQARMEWNGEGRIGDYLIAGDHIIATDACGSRLMDTDPRFDWPTPPFRRDRSPVAAEHGFGTVDLDEIDFSTEGLEPLVAEFDSAEVGPVEQIAILRQTASEQALFYRDNRDNILDAHAGRYIFLQDGEVIWSGLNPQEAGAVQNVAAGKGDQAVWLKLADPEEREGEQMSVYEKILAA